MDKRLVTWAMLAVLMICLSRTGFGVSWEHHEDWAGDLRFLEEELIRLHPDPFAEVEQEVFDSEIRGLEQRLGDLEPHEIVAEISRIVALIGDGHTRLTLPLAPGIEFFQGHASTPPPSLEGLLVHQFPIRLGLFKEGLFVTAVDRAFPGGDELLGARVVQMGELSVEDAIAAVSPTIERDNEWQVRYHLPERLVLAEVLHARGVVEDRGELPIVVETATGSRSAVLPSVTGERAVVWSRSGKEPMLEPSTELFSLSEVAPGVLLLRIDQIGDSPSETLADLAERLGEALDKPEVERLVIDLRRNRGGDNSLGVPLLHTLIRADKLQVPASLFVLVGRTTFSAAMMLSVDLERHTRAVFVGEPTGSSPNHFGDSARRQLPFSGLTVRISTREWQYSHPLEERDAIRPLIGAAPTAAAHFAGRDPGLEAILQFIQDSEGPKTGNLEGHVSYRRNTYPIAMELTDDGALVDLRAAGIAPGRLRAREFARDGARLSFFLTLAEQRYRIEAEIRGDTLVGYLDDRRRGGTLVLRLEAEQ